MESINNQNELKKHLEELNSFHYNLSSIKNDFDIKIIKKYESYKKFTEYCKKFTEIHNHIIKRNNELNDMIKELCEKYGEDNMKNSYDYDKLVESRIYAIKEIELCDKLNKSNNELLKYCNEFIKQYSLDTNKINISKNLLINSIEKIENNEFYNHEYDCFNELDLNKIEESTKEKIKIINEILEISVFDIDVFDMDINQI